MKQILLHLLTLCIFSTATKAQNWSELGTGSNALKADSIIYATAVDKNTGNVYAAGAFKNTNGKRYVAKWDGASWTELGTGIDTLKANADILSLLVDNSGNVYAAGEFTNSNGKQYLAKWDGTNWSELGGNNSLKANNWILTTTIDRSGNIYAAGNFTDSQHGMYVAKWNGTNWSELGTGTHALNANSTINSIAVDSAGKVYAAGDFFSAQYYEYVAKWDGTNWTELKTTDPYSNPFKPNNLIFAISLDRTGNVYATGQFTNNGYEYVAKFDGTIWSELGGSGSMNANYSVKAMAIESIGNVYAAGAYTDYTGYHYVQKFNGTSWSKVGAGATAIKANGNIYSLSVNDSGNIYAAGVFKNADGYRYVAQWSPTTVVTAIDSHDNKLNIELYPNPTKGFVNINLAEEGQINVYNFSGELVTTQQANIGSSSIDLSNLSSGIYTLLFNGWNTSYAPVKLVKE